MLRCLYEDAGILVVEKPAGYESQEGGTFSKDMVSEIRNYLVAKPGAPKGIPYVGVVHRLDKPVCGVMVYAKTKEVAAALSRQVAEKTDLAVRGDVHPSGVLSMEKVYYALVWDEQGLVNPVGEERRDWLYVSKKEKKAYLLSGKVPATGEGCDAKTAILRYQVVETVPPKPLAMLSGILCGAPVKLLRIELLTGRFHQIRAQLSAAGFPVVGDTKYAVGLSEPAQQKNRMLPLGLCAYELAFTNPLTGERQRFHL